MTPANSWNELIGQISIRTDKILDEKVSEFVKDKILIQIQDDVYSYPETRYKRRYSSGGIGDKSSLKHHVKNGVLSVFSTAAPNRSVFNTKIRNDSVTIFSEWIDSGSWMDLTLFKETGIKSKRAARPFMKNTKKKINTTFKKEIKKTIRIGLSGK